MLDSPGVQTGSIMSRIASEFSNEIGDNSLSCQNSLNSDSGSEVFRLFPKEVSLCITAFQLGMISSFPDIQ